MDDLKSLQSLGLELPSAAYLLGSVVFGIAGFAAYRFGKKAGRPRTKWLGVALMLYPYGIPVTWLLYVIGIVLCAAVYADSRLSSGS